MVEEIVQYVVIGTMLLIVLNFFANLISDFKLFLEDKKQSRKLKKQAKEYVKRKIEREKNAPKKFYGLLEFEFTNCNDVQSLKDNCCNTIKKKIKSKYKDINLQLDSSNKIYFNYHNFSKMDVLIDDFIKLYDSFAQINKQRRIKTFVRFALWTKSGDIDTQEANSILDKLNRLNLLNQVIANDGIYEQYKNHHLSLFNFDPRGIVKLTENNEDVEIYKLFKPLVSDRNNK